MKNLLSAGKLALLGIVLSGVSPIFGQWTGSLDSASCTTISGWLANTTSLNTSYSVDIYDGSTLVTTAVASTFRQDLVNAGFGNGDHGFSISTPSSLLNGAAHSITATPHGVALGVANLPGSPKSITCGGTAHNYGGSLDGVGCATIGGWAWDSDNPGSALTVDVYVDGSTTAAATFVANQYRADVQAAGIGTGYYGYTIPSPSILQNGQTHSVSVRPAGVSTDVLAGSPKTISCSSHLYTGWLDGADCTTIRGWAADLDNENVAQTVTLYVDGVATSTTVVANLYRADVQNYIGGNGDYGFSFKPPASLSDGSLHSITVGFGSPVAFLVSSVPYSFSCDANGIEGIDESGGSSCSSFEVTLSSTPTLTTNGTTTTYPAGTVSGFYLTNPGDSLTTNVEGVVTQYSQGATFSASVGYYAPASNNANPNPFSDSAAPGNSIFSYSGNSGFYQNMSFNMGSSMAGNFYLGGQATLNTCRGTIGPMGYVAFLEHVTAKPTITSITTYPTTAMTTSGPLIVGQPGAVVMSGTNLGESGTVTFTLVGGGQSFQGTYNGYNSTQAVIQSVVAPVAGTYNVVDQETTDVTGFSYAEAGAAGSPPAGGGPQATATNQPVTITGGPGVPLGGSNTFTIQIPNGNQVPVALSITNPTTGTGTGTGSATFATAPPATITQTTTVTIQGNTVSSTANNITLTASANGKPIQTLQLTVVNVVISMNASPPAAQDDSVTEYYSSGPAALGAGVYTLPPPAPGRGESCNVGVELVGRVTPSNFPGKVTLRRSFATTSPGELYISGNVAQGLFTNGSRQPGGDDTSGPNLLARGLSTSGNVFDIDAPGTGLSNDLVPWRIRFNFVEYAVLGDFPGGSVYPNPPPPTVSQNFLWWAAVSCTQDGDGNLLLSNDVPGDNLAAPGTTKITWNLR